MRHAAAILGLLDALETFHGKHEAQWPTDPYEFIVWWHCGYPASDVTCAKGWEALVAQVGIAPDRLLEALPNELTSALRAGGMVPELRGMRLKETAMLVKNQAGGDLRAALHGPLSKARKLLKTFPGIADPGADRILLFGGIAPIAAVPSNCTQVLVRMLHGSESENYGANYREGQQAIKADIAETFEARTRAYLLLKRHGQEICKRAKPQCERCPVSASCEYFNRRMKGAKART